MDRQSHKTVSTRLNRFEEKGEPKRYSVGWTDKNSHNISAQAATFKIKK